MSWSPDTLALDKQGSSSPAFERQSLSHHKNSTGLIPAKSLGTLPPEGNGRRGKQVRHPPRAHDLRKRSLSGLPQSQPWCLHTGSKQERPVGAGRVTQMYLHIYLQRRNRASSVGYGLSFQITTKTYGKGWNCIDPPALLGLGGPNPQQLRKHPYRAWDLQSSNRVTVRSQGGP